MNDLSSGRLRREMRTVEAMIAITCRDLHGGDEGTLCAPCSELVEYARFRLERCPFGAAKPTCGNCKIHCYRPEPRARIQEVMRHAGPRMVLSHPVLALLHLLVDERRPAPEKPPRRTTGAPPPSPNPI